MAQESETIATWVKFEVFGIDPDNPDPGRLSVRRLNRAEYENTINDLMGIHFDAKLILPADDSGHGFDNVGDALSLSPLLMEKYVKVARMVVGESVPMKTKVASTLMLGSNYMVRLTLIRHGISSRFRSTASSVLKTNMVGTSVS